MANPVIGELITCSINTNIVGSPASYVLDGYLDYSDGNIQAVQLSDQILAITNAHRFANIGFYSISFSIESKNFHLSIINNKQIYGQFRQLTLNLNEKNFEYYFYIFRQNLSENIFVQILPRKHRNIQLYKPYKIHDK